MATTTANAVQLMERAAFGLANRVDTDAGVIRGVKIVGLHSRNIGRVLGLDPRDFGDAIDKPYAYSRRALESAIPKYEGATVRINHPRTRRGTDGRRVIEETSRPLFSTFGQLRNVVMRADGLYGDLEYIKSHDAAPKIVEMAQRMPSKLALSHNARGNPTLKNGRVVIDEILEVASVDIVGDRPGTTNGLFESALLPSTEKTKMEMTTLSLSEQVAEVLASDLDDAAKLKRIAALVADSGADNPFGGADVDAMESLARTRAELSAHKLLAGAGVELCEEFVDAVAHLPTEHMRERFVAKLRERSIMSGLPRRPDRVAPRLLEDAANFHGNESVEDWARRLKHM